MCVLERVVHTRTRTHGHTHTHTHRHTHTVLDVSTTRTRLPQDARHPPSPIPHQNQNHPPHRLHTPHNAGLSRVSQCSKPASMHPSIHRPVASPGPTAPTPWRRRRRDATSRRVARRRRRRRRPNARCRARRANERGVAIDRGDRRTDDRARIRHSVERTPRAGASRLGRRPFIHPCRARRRRRAADEG